MFSLIRRIVTFAISILLLGFAVAMAFESQAVRAILFPLPPATLLRYSFDTPNDTPFQSHSNPAPTLNICRSHVRAGRLRKLPGCRS
jgi:hypothetical protein